MKFIKRILVLLLVFMIPILSTGSHIIRAETGYESSNNTIKFNSPTNNFFTDTYGQYKNEKVFYNLDFIDSTELEEEGLLDKINIIKKVGNKAEGTVYNLLHQLFIEFPFSAIKTATSAVIWLFNVVYDVNIVNELITEIEESVVNIAGISNGKFTDSGLFGGFSLFIAIAVAIYTLYQVLVKRASITAFSGLLKSIIALVIALAFISNYGTFIKGLNTLSVEASTIILTGQTTTVVNDQGNIDNATAKDQMNQTIWDTFVHKPYLMLQYGTMNEDEIGTGRIYNLLKIEPNTEARYDFVLGEIEKGNEMMTRTKMQERILFLSIVLVANFFNSIPILILSFMLLLFQFWFIAMAMIAPFVLVWSAFPNQFGVLTRYMLELATPLLLKLGVSVLALLIFSLTSVLMNVSTNAFSSTSIFGFIFLSWCQGILFFTLFLLRKRIMNVFSRGSKELAHLREGISNSFVNPLKRGVQVTASAVGAGIGAVGGVQGAMIGANVGGSIGKVATGDLGIEETARNVGMSMYLNDKIKSSNHANVNKNMNDQADNASHGEKIYHVDKVNDSDIGNSSSPSVEHLGNGNSQAESMEINKDHADPIGGYASMDSLTNELNNNLTNNELDTESLNNHAINTTQLANNEVPTESMETKAVTTQQMSNNSAPIENLESTDINTQLMRSNKVSVSDMDTKAISTQQVPINDLQENTLSHKPINLKGNKLKDNNLNYREIDSSSINKSREISSNNLEDVPLARLDFADSPIEKEVKMEQENINLNDLMDTNNEDID